MENLSSTCTEQGLETSATEIDNTEDSDDLKVDSCTTKLLLENVCNDFESIDVFNSKNKPMFNTPLELKSLKNSGLSENITVDSKHISLVNDQRMGKEKQSNVNLLHEKPHLDSNLLTINSNLKAIGNTNECSILNNIEFVTDDGNKHTSSSLAELADAELIQTDDNSVSLVITNPRLIKVNTGHNSLGKSEPCPNVELMSDNPEDIADNVTDEHITFVYSNSGVDSETVTNYIVEEPPDFEEEIVTTVIPRYQPSNLRHKFATKGKSKFTRSKTNVEIGKGLRARKITLKMKNAWSKELESAGFVTCPMPGCSQTYVSIANFQTHYKYCTGKKTLKHCPYCDSLILSSENAILHHMKVEHPEKIKDYAEKYNIEEELFHLYTPSSSENTSSEITNQKNLSFNKRKNSFKENMSKKNTPQKTILKHKMKQINETVIQNISEFKKCVRFNDIVHKMNSDVAKAVDIKFFKSKRRKILIPEEMGEEKYFSDDMDDVLHIADFEKSEIGVDADGRVNTKSRLVLNMERYKRYNECLKITRDWASDRRTYSRSKHSDNSFDSPIKGDSSVECIQDVHQLTQSSPEAMCVSLNNSEREIISLYDEISTEIPGLEELQSSLYIDNKGEELSNKFTAIRDKNKRSVSNKTVNINAIHPVRISHNEQSTHRSLSLPTFLTIENSVSPAGEKFATISVRPTTKRRVTCYDKKITTQSPLHKELMDSPVTYGVKKFTHTQIQEPQADFDSLIKKQKIVPKCKGAITGEHSQSFLKTSSPISPAKSKGKYLKQDGVKLPSDFKSSEVKRKRGRPRKHPVDDSLLKSEFVKQKVITKKQVKNKLIAKSINKDPVQGRVSRFKCLGLHRLTAGNKGVTRFGGKRPGLAALNKLVNTINNKYRKKRFAQFSKQNSALMDTQREVYGRKKEKSGKRFCAPKSTKSENIKSAIILQSDPSKNESIENLPNSVPFQNSVAENCIQKLSEDSTNSVKKSCPNDNFPISQDNRNDILITHIVETTDEGLNFTKEVIAEPFPMHINESVEIVSEESSNILKYHEPIQKHSLNKTSSESQINASVVPLKDESQSKNLNSISPDHSYSYKDNLTTSASDANDLPSSSTENAIICPFETNLNNTTFDGQKESASLNDKPKRGRGRRKKVLEANLIVTSNVENTIVDKKSSVPRESLSRDKFFEEAENLQTPHVPSDVQNNNEAQSETVSSGLRKSLRVQKQKLSDSSHEKKPEEKIASAPVSDEQMPTPMRTGKRGRPRKYPLSTEDKIESKTLPEYETPKIEDTVLRKCARKGRPRKCVSYADLNLGVDSSESHDEASCEKKKELLLLGNENEINNSNRDEKYLDGSKKTLMEKFNTSEFKEASKTLPLKKRKQLPELNENSLSVSHADTKELAASEALSVVSKAENRALKKKEKQKCLQTITEDKDSKEINAVEKDERRFSKRTSARFQVKDNLAEIILPKKLRNKSETKKKLDSNAVKITPDPKDIEQTKPTLFKTKPSSEKSKNFVRKLIEDHIGKRKLKKALVFRNTKMKAYKQFFWLSRKHLKKREKMKTFHLPDLMIKKRARSLGVSPSNFMLKYISNYSSESLFPNFKPQTFMWKLLEEQKKDFLPPLENSAMIKIANGKTKVETDWFSLKCFETAPVHENSGQFTFFTGGPVWSSAFCPTPIHVRATQHIAISTSNSVDCFHKFEAVGEKGLLQFWDLGHLDIANLECIPKLKFCISHNHGVICDMSWCPSGCWEDPLQKSKDFMPRMGLLAIACSDSYIRIYSIPHPDELQLQSSEIPFYCSWPVAFLRPLYGGPSRVTQKAKCVSLTWQQNDGCECIAGGYGNGMVFIWKISSVATILAKDVNVQKTFQPFLAFQGHGSPITGISFCSFLGSRFLVTGGFDTTLKFWDTLDTSMPLYTVNRGGSRSVHCSPQWCGAFVSMDDGMSVTRSTYFKDCGIRQTSPRCLSNHNSCIWSCSLSEWLNVQAVGDAAGEVSVTLVKSLQLEHIRATQERRYPFFRTEIRPIQNTDFQPIITGVKEEIKWERIEEHSEAALAGVTDVVDVLYSTVDAVGEIKQTYSEVENAVSCLVDSTEEMILSHEVFQDAVILVKDLVESIEKRSNDTFKLRNGSEKFSTDPCPRLKVIRSSDEVSKYAKVSNLESSKQTFSNNPCRNSSQEVFLDKGGNEVTVPADISHSLAANFRKCETHNRIEYCGSNNSDQGDKFSTKRAGPVSEEKLENFDYHADDFKDKKMEYETIDTLESSTSLDSNTETSSSGPVSSKNFTLDLNVKEATCKAHLYRSESPTELSSFTQLQASGSVTSNAETITVDIQSKVAANSTSLEQPDILKADIRTERIYQLSVDINDSECTDPDCADPECSCRDMDFDSDEDLGLDPSDSDYSSPTIELVDVGTDPKEQRNDAILKACEKVSNNSINGIISNDVLDNELTKYEDLSNKHGLVFKEFDLRDITDVDQSELQRLLETDKMSTVPDKHYKLSSINTVTWNPNYGSHFWLFTAGQSGIGHLSCASGLRNAIEGEKYG